MNMQGSLLGMMLSCAVMVAMVGCANAAPKPETESRTILRDAGAKSRCGDATHRRVNALSDAIANECAFAKTMADRDFAAFAAFLDDDAVFFNNDGALLGKHAVLKEWKPYFDAAAAPFSWEPTQAHWNGKDFAYTTGPVYDASGKCVARFNSIWRKHADGHWRIVFDKGDGKCDPAVIPGGGVTGTPGHNAAQADPG